VSADTLAQSFAGGEITPELFGRLDLGKFQTGLALARNWLVLPHGPVQNRPGLAWVNQAWKSATNVRLIPFSFSAVDTTVLEFGHQYIRFHLNGVPLLEAAQTIVSKALGLITIIEVTAHGYVVGETFYSNIQERFYLVGAVPDADHIQAQLLDGTDIDTTGLPPYAGGETVQRVYTIASPYTSADLFALHYTQSADVLTITHPTYPTQELRRSGALAWALAAVSFAPTLSAPAAPTVGIVGAGGTPVVHDYVITAIAADGLEESLASAVSTSAAIDLAVAGNKVTITPSAALPAEVTRFNVYKKLSGLFGYVGQSAAAGVFDDNNITPDMTKTPPEASITLNTGAGYYPSAVAYHEQRRVFAATNLDPQGYWMTRPGTENNLTTSIPSQDDDAISQRIKAREQNRIRHLVPLGDLMALTVGGEWRIFSGDAPVVTPTTISAKQQGGSGANNSQPVLTSGSILYVQAQGSHVRELAFSSEKEGFVSTDMSIMAAHLVDRHTILDLAYSRAPLQTLWAVRSDGRLLGMTYVPEHQVFAWHQHDTVGGFFESVAVVAENNEDVLYCVVRRVIGGNTVRNIERMASRLFSDKAHAFVVDSGRTFVGAATTTVYNLHHLEGETVSILADGAIKTPQVVANGAITIDTPASRITAGLPITADLMTLPLSMMAARLPAAGQGTKKNINGAALRTHNTTGLKCGPSFDKLTEVPARRNESYGQPPEMRSELRRVTITPSWGEDAMLCVRQTEPLPATLLSIALDVATGG
jgi:hypothetical protein